MASTREAAIQLRTYPAFPAAPHRGGGEPVLFIAFFLRNPRGGGLPSEEAYLHGPVTSAQRLTSKAHMSDPRWRDTRPSRPYGGEPEGRTPRREPRGSDPRRPAGDGRGREDDAATRRMPAQPGVTQPVAPPRVDSRAAGPRARGSGGRLSRIWQGSLSGGLGICVVLGSGLIGTIATIVTRAQPGSVLGLAVLAGTVAAALTVQPRTGRMIFPVPALSYLVGALASGVVYDRSANKTELAVGAAQWIANGFFVMVLATLLAIALTTVRWFMWRRDQQGPVPPDWSAPGSPGTRPGQQWPPGSQGTRGWDQRPGPRTGLGPYNF